MVVYSDELCHHGILGMKWGIRRYQNKDGTLTSAGKRRYATGKVEPPAHEDYLRARAKTPREMSDKELNDAVLRLTREVSYNRLAANSNAVSAGRRRAEQLVKDATTVAGIAGGLVAIATNYEKLGNIIGKSMYVGKHLQ